MVFGLRRIEMALSQSVEESLKEAEAALRNALSYAARQERPMVCSVVADMISRIDTLIHTDALLDKLENKIEKWNNFSE